MEDYEIAPSWPYCWYCGREESSREELLCLCADKFIHVYCLMEIANTSNILNCLFCGARYPLEKRPKSLLKMHQKVCKHYFMMLFSIFSIFLSYIIGLIICEMLSDFYFVHDPLDVPSYFVINIALGILLWYIYMTVSKIVDWSNRIFEPFRQWYKSTYEWKLIRPSTVNNIEEYNIQE